LGRALTTTATQYANSLQRRAVLDVMAKDKAAIRTYENLGWVHLADLRHAYGHDQYEPALAFISPASAL